MSVESEQTKISIGLKIVDKQRFEQIKQKINAKNHEEVFIKLLNVYEDYIKTTKEFDYRVQKTMLSENINYQQLIELALEAFIVKTNNRIVKQCGQKSQNAELKVINKINELINQNENVKDKLDKIYINLGVLLKKLEGKVNQNVIKRVLIKMDKELKNHHLKHELSYNHNRDVAYQKRQYT